MAALISIPADFARVQVELYGAEGQAWLDALPALVAACARRWGLTVDPPFALSYNWVAPAQRADGLPVVLKLGVPTADRSAEIAALEHYAGRGSVRLLASDAEAGIMLLERLMPGTMLAELPDDEAATRVAAGVMRQLWQPVAPDAPFPTVAEWAGGLVQVRPHYGGGTGPVPLALLEEAEALFADLLPSQAAPVLLHGDLHHDNILAAGDGRWRAIDPQGVIGEPAYEVGALIRNPRLPELVQIPHLERLLARRLDILSEELGLDRARLLAWSMAQAVLSGWWDFEGHGHGGEPAMVLAAILSTMRRGATN